MIYPVNGPHLWEMTSYCDVLPPTKRVLRGRPKKKCRLKSWELKKDYMQVRQSGTRKRCGICRQLGHKRNNCPQAPPPQQQPNPTTSTTHQGGTQPTQTQVTQSQPSQPVQPTETQPSQPVQPTQTQASQPLQPTQTQPSQITGRAPILLSQPQQGNMITQGTQIPLPSQPTQISSFNVVDPPTRPNYREKLSYRKGPISKQQGPNFNHFAAVFCFFKLNV